jgi:hypothetical protein
MRNSYPWIGIGIATLTSMIFGGLLGAAQWGGLGTVLGALIGGALAIFFVWIAGVLIITLFTVLRRMLGYGSMASEFEIDRDAGTVLQAAPWIVVILAILGIYFLLNR